MLVTGEIQNNTTKNYTAALFRIFLFDKKHNVLGKATFKLDDFKAARVKPFEVQVEDIPNIPIQRIASCDILWESGY